MSRHLTILKNKYKYVKYIQRWSQGRIRDTKWCASIPNYNWSCFFDEEKEAAKAVDLFLISKGKEPGNILKRKTK